MRTPERSFLVDGWISRLHATSIHNTIARTMSQRAFSLPIRTIATKAVKPQWICRRCLATQQSNSTPSEKYSKGRTSELLSTQLQQKHLPPQVLSHVNAQSLPINEQEQWEKVEPHKKIVGVVVSHGKMDKTVRVRVAAQRWNQRIKKVQYLWDEME